MLEELTEKQAMTTISKHCGVSCQPFREHCFSASHDKSEKELVASLFIDG